ncbi:MAG: adenylate/guanylate cyclase domain-containing protein [Rhodoferax sp.]|jgi:class 3 adenylate cyclase|nr:adenylate/guanylate cyclase domain-containing protein [Rhodoferax sp.]MBP9150299.1 adenylate/guanylate cyclase domain-containing protein [Rhodoferax sp.]
MDNANVKRRLTCILAADAVGYSKQMGQDEEGTIQVLSAHRAVIDGIIAFHHGRIVGTAGDSVLAEFSSAVEAVRCAVEIQDALKTRNDALPDVRKMLFRVGVNLGDVVVKNDDLLGDGVNVAARLETMAEPGGICIASSVYDQITGKLDLGFQDIGEQNLKNISRPVRVYRIGGVNAVQRPTPADTRSMRPKWPIWAVGMVGVALVAGIGLWQSGAMTKDRVLTGGPTVSSGTDVASLAPAPPSSSAKAELLQAQAQAQQLRDEAQTLRLQAQAELQRAQALAAQAAKVNEHTQTLSQSSPKQPPPPPPPPPPKPKQNEPGLKAATSRANSSAARSASTPDLARFDGAWQIQINCRRPSGGTTQQSLDVVAKVNQGVLHGETGQEGEPGWRQIHGQIGVDGHANLVAKVIPNENVRRKRNAPMTTIEFPAVFQEISGRGQTQHPRVCSINFSKT